MRTEKNIRKVVLVDASSHTVDTVPCVVEKATHYCETAMNLMKCSSCSIMLWGSFPSAKLLEKGMELSTGKS